MTPPEEIRLLSGGTILKLVYADVKYELSAEYLRVHSPSAEVQGHGQVESRLVTGKEQVKIVAVEPVGNYAVKLVFDDEHDTGLFSWRVLDDLATNQQAYLQRYAERVAQMVSIKELKI